MVHFFTPGYSGPVLIHPYTIECTVDNFAVPGYRTLVGQTEFQVAPEKIYRREGFPVPASWDLQRPASDFRIPRMIVGQPALFSFSGSEWVYVRFVVEKFSVAFNVVTTVLTPGLEISLLVRRSIKPTLLTYLGVDSTPDNRNEQTVRVTDPIVGAFYVVGIYARQQALTVTAASDPRASNADVSLRISTEAGVEVFPSVTSLTNYFVYFDTIQSLTYRYYKINVPADMRDISIIVTRLNNGLTDIIVSNVDPFPTNSKYSPDKIGKGWWKSEAATGESHCTWNDFKLSLRSHSQDCGIQRSVWSKENIPLQI